MKNLSAFYAIVTSALLFAGCGVSDEPAADNINTEMTLSAETSSEETSTFSDIPETTEQITETEAITYYKTNPSDLEYYNFKRTYDITDRCKSCDLDDDIKELFNQAYYIEEEIGYLNSYKMVGLTLDPEKRIDGDMYGSGYSYESFYNYLTDVFTEKYADHIVNGHRLYKNIDGELFFYDIEKNGGRGGRYGFDEAVITTESISEDSIKFNAEVSYYSGFYEDNGPFVSTYEYEAIKTPDGWRFDRFEEWE